MPCVVHRRSVLRMTRPEERLPEKMAPFYLFTYLFAE